MSYPRCSRVRSVAFMAGFTIVGGIAASLWLPPTRVASRDAHSTVPTASIAASPTPRNLDAFGRIPLSFTANCGQMDSSIEFSSRGPGYDLRLTNADAVLDLRRVDRKEPDQDVAHDRIRVRFQGAGSDPKATALDELPGKVNYLVGRDPSQWHRNVPTFARVRYESVYPGVDVVYYGNGKQLEYDLVVAPGADPNAITLAFDGTTRVRIDADGRLVIGTNGGDLVQLPPVIYQPNGDERHSIPGGYVAMAENCIGFEVGDYDASKPLIIDPTLLYSTYFGGSFHDDASAIAIDEDGNVYLAGTTFSDEGHDFPLNGCDESFNGGFRDVFVSKLDAAGTTLEYSTYLGGSDEDYGYAIAVDANGYVAVVGTTKSGDFPAISSFQSNLRGDHDAFAAKLSPDGSSFVFSTYIGSDDYDNGTGVAMDSAGGVIVVGNTWSDTFPTKSPMQPTYGGGLFDGFVAKLRSDSGVLVWSTFLGGESLESCEGVTVDSSRNVWVCGYTDSDGFPCKNAFQKDRAGADDAFVTEIKADGQSMIFSTYVGGGDSDEAHGIALDPEKNAYVTGLTYSADFPTIDGYQTGQGGADAFVSKVKYDGSELVYSTHIGGSSDDFGDAIAVDRYGNAFVAGHTASADFPMRHPLYATRGVADDAFVTMLSATGDALVYSTYLPSDGTDDKAAGIAVDSDDNAFVCGSCTTNFPTANAYDSTFNGGRDAFIAKIGPGTANLSVTMTGVPDPVNSGGEVVYTVTITNAGPDDATSVLALVEVEPNLTFTSATADLSTALVDLDAGDRFVVYASIPNGESRIITVHASADCSENDDNVQFQAEVGATTSDTNNSNNLAAGTTTIFNPPPQIVCPANILTNADSPLGKTVVYTAPVVTDNCADPTAICVPASGSLFPFGTTVVTCTATDSGGKTANCNFNVKVVGVERAVLFVADTLNNRVQKFDGQTWTVMDTAPLGNQKLRAPEAVACDLTGDMVFVADTGNSRILKWTESSKTWTAIATRGSGPNQVLSPKGLALDGFGNLYVADTGNSRVLRFTGGAAGTGTVIAGIGVLAHEVLRPMGLAVNLAGTLYIADSGNSRIVRCTDAYADVSAASFSVVAGAGAGTNPGQVRRAEGVGVDNANNLYVADTGNARILMFSNGNPGAATVLAASATAAGAARGPEGVTVSRFTLGVLSTNSALVVSNTGNNKINGKLDPTSAAGTWRVLGTGGTGVGQFSKPSKIR
ncbi:MAG: SBBP repeat-containing protein [Planctomycetes bacterium]|nr:SBBP repeat-containing protein [Planctomycetota bacterium]